MSWLVLTLLSSVLLGCYEIAKKHAVSNNAVPPVLLLNVLTASLIWVPLLSLSWYLPESVPKQLAATVALTWQQHGLLMLKSVLVGASWTLALFALKHLPLSIAPPIRATGPLWTVAAAVAFLGERPTGLQWLGISIVVVAFFAFSQVGKREGIHFHRDKWVFAMIGATLLGSASALYDKYLLQTLQIPALAVQAWFSVYLVPVMLPLAGYWFQHQRKTNPFKWRSSIPLIAILLLATDLLYFVAVSDPQAMISVISPLRRTSIVIGFAYAVVVLRENNWRRKGICTCLILLGIVLLSV